MNPLLLRRFGLLFVLGWVVLLAHTSTAQVVTTFDTDLEGWLVTGDNSASWEPTTGNPGGCLSVNDLATGIHNYAIAPPVYLGDWSGFTAADTLAFDVYLHNTSGGSHSTGPYMMRVAGPGGAAYAIDPEANYPPDRIWTTYAASLDPAEWTITSGTWSEILENVTSVRLNGEYVYGDEITRIDNVRLTATPSVAFEECAAAEFNESGTGDWSFLDTGGVSNPGSSGNPGGYVQVGDRAGVNSYALAPSMFLGDWSSLDGSGLVSIDLRILSHSGTNEGSPQFILISGPGGSAYVSLAAGALPTSAMVWKRFEFPVDSTVWTLDTGTWTGLLASVTECRIDLEFYDGTETVGFDNFARLSAHCGPVADPVMIHDADVFHCSWYSLIGVYSVALNPADNELYGVVRLSPSSGGGLYTATGPIPGTKLSSHDRPAHLIFADDGDAFVSEDYSGNVYRLEWGGSSSIWVSGFHSGDDDPFGMIFAPSGFNGPNVSAGDILVSDRGSSGPDQIWAFSPDSAEGERLVMPDPGDVDQFDLAATHDGDVYVSDAFDNNNLYLLAPDGGLTTFGLGTPIGGPGSIVYDPHDDVFYVSSLDNESVWRVERSTAAVTLVADGFVSLGACCLEIDTVGRRLWVTDTGANRVYRLCLGDPTAAPFRRDAPASFGALTVSPNPLRSVTTIRFETPHTAVATIRIYDVAGRLVSNLFAGSLGRGSHAIPWDGRNARGQAVPTGVYFVRLEIDSFPVTQKIVRTR